MQAKNYGSNWIINKPLKTKTSTILFALFFGGIGAHRYYLEHYWRFFFSLLFCWTLIPAIIALFDVFMFAAMSKKKFDDKYNDPFATYQCPGCDERLYFWNLPILGAGKLKDGGQICLKCYWEITKIEGLKFNSRNYDKELVRQIIYRPTIDLPSIPKVEFPPIPAITELPPIPKMDNETIISFVGSTVENAAIGNDDIEEDKSLIIPEIKEETLEDTLNELNSLVGLREIKWEINKLIDSVKIQKSRQEMGLRVAPEPYHLVFTGNPGTGKKTAARIVARIFKHLGVLMQGHLVECDQLKMIAGNPEQTIINLNKIIDSAQNGVLYIDEINTLSQLDDDCKKEAIATLIKRMEEDNNKFIVILGARTKEIRRYSDLDPGFRARFNRYINFPDYKLHELEEIQKRDSEKNNLEW